MAQVDLQTALTMLERRLLVTEGQIFALQSVLSTILAADDAAAGELRQHLTVTEAIFQKGFEEANDQVSRDYIAAAKTLLSGLLADDEQSKLKLTVIEGGKPDC